MAPTIGRRTKRGGITLSVVKKMKKKLTEYKAVVFDLDGTLYYQRKLRIKMAWMLFSYYLCHFWRIKELFVIKKFREVRENWDEITAASSSGPKAAGTGAADVQGDTGLPGLEDEQYGYVAGVMKCSAATVKTTVETWMYEKPLKAVADTADRELLKIIEGIRRGGQKVFIFSDYPIEDKLKALGLTVDGMYAATDERVNELKPSPKGLKLIMEDNGFAPDEILIIGDRMSRDGQSAINADCDYLILPKSAGERARIYKTI